VVELGKYDAVERLKVALFKFTRWWCYMALVRVTSRGMRART
jgi:hypothetical protein